MVRTSATREDQPRPDTGQGFRCRRKVSRRAQILSIRASWFAGLRGRDRGKANHAVDPALIERAQRALHPDDRLFRPGVHRAVEDDIVDAGGKLVALHGVQYCRS